METTGKYLGTAYRLTGDPAKPVHGAHPAVVLIHGVGLHCGMWRETEQRLAADFTVLRYDLYGHGESAAAENTMDGYVAQLARLTNHLGMQRIKVAGFSFGGLIARAFAAAHPERVSRLAVLHGVYQRTAGQQAAVLARLRAAEEEPQPGIAETALARWFSPAYRRSHARVMDEVRAMFPRRDGYLNAYRLFADADRVMQPYPPSGVACPALIITGDQDANSTPAMARALAGDLPGGRVIINPGHRHLAPLAPAEHAAVIARQLGEFLSEAKKDDKD